MEKIAKIIEKYPFVRRENLIPILQDIQDEFGYLTEEALRELGDCLDLPTSKIYSLATFYSKFRFHPKGKFHLKLCRGTSCHLKGSTHLMNVIADRLSLSEGETSKDGNFSLEVVSCMGACEFGPVLAVNDKYYTSVDEEKLNEVIDYYTDLEV